MLATLSRWRRGFKSHRGRCASRESSVGRVERRRFNFYLITTFSKLLSRIPCPHGIRGQVVQLVDTRRSERRAPHGAWEFDSPLGHCRQGRRPTGFHKAGMPGSLPGSATEIDPVVKRHDTSMKCWGDGSIPSGITVGSSDSGVTRRTKRSHD